MEKLRVPGFLGVFACDRVPQKVFPGQSLIINTDPHHEPGQHFVALAHSTDYYYFDPLALEASLYFPRMVRELKKRRVFSKLKSVLTRPIQASGSKFCGFYCIDYILSPSRTKKGKKNGGFKNYSRVKLESNDAKCIENILQMIRSPEK